MYIAFSPSHEILYAEFIAIGVIVSNFQITSFLTVLKYYKNVAIEKNNDSPETGITWAK